MFTIYFGLAYTFNSFYSLFLSAALRVFRLLCRFPCLCLFLHEFFLFFNIYILDIDIGNENSISTWFKYICHIFRQIWHSLHRFNVSSGSVCVCVCVSHGILKVFYCWLKAIWWATQSKKDLFDLCCVTDSIRQDTRQKSDETSGKRADLKFVWNERWIL